MPVFLFKGVELYGLRGGVKISCPISCGMIRLGGRGVSIFDKTCYFVWDNHGSVEFRGAAYIGSGSKISVAEGGFLSLGNYFSVSAHSSIACKKKIYFGDNCRLSWDILIMDSDYHKIIKDGNVINPPKDIYIGSHVWIGCRCTILKGVVISDDVIIAARSLIAKSFSIPHCIISGDGKEVYAVKENTTWET